MIALSRFWIDRGHRHDACLWLETAPLAEASVDPSLRAAALEAAGLLDYFVVTDPDQAERYYTQSLALHRELGNTQRVAFLLNRLGRIASERADLDTANSFHRDALALFEESTDNAGRAATLHLLAGVARDQGSYDESERLFTDAIRLARSSFPGLVRHSLHSLGDLALDRGDYAGRGGLLPGEPGDHRDKRTPQPDPVRCRHRQRSGRIGGLPPCHPDLGRRRGRRACTGIPHARRRAEALRAMGEYATWTPR